ncbi:manganese efflux pump [Chryseobacterium gambrini]|uniref:manganese efflux pump n=1 Tax=Chryseobacterium gambrini TaxID=373672 RepID=UPI0022F37D81|nr:manganese efflux pump [Chryseobacterium gambrini]WBX98946.1 manganese efflux pump [Chryseobacterium gambrini]
MQNTIDWYNGEIFEGKFILAFGLFLILTALLFYFLGNTPAAKALLIPMLVIGIFFSITGANMIRSNGKQKQEAAKKYEQNPKEFINAEIKRVDDFQYLYPMSIAISLACFLIAIALLYFTQNVNLKAIAISLLLFGMAFAVIDYFSKERATIYYEQLKS